MSPCRSLSCCICVPSHCLIEKVFVWFRSVSGALQARKVGLCGSCQPKFVCVVLSPPQSKQARMAETQIALLNKQQIQDGLQQEDSALEGEQLQQSPSSASAADAQKLPELTLHSWLP